MQIYFFQLNVSVFVADNANKNWADSAPATEVPSPQSHTQSSEKEGH